MTIINSINKGKQPVIDTLNVTPSTTAQTITATGGTDGYSPVNVSAVTSSIDANIVAGNIKDGVSILGVTGNYQGTQPTGTKNITANGVYDVTNYASADVQVPTTAPAHYIEYPVNSAGALLQSSTIMNFSGLDGMTSYVLYSAYYKNTSISGTLDMSGVARINGDSACEQAFQGCTGLTTVDLSSLTYIGYNSCKYMFKDCTGITSVDLSSLTSVYITGAYYMFNGCTNLTTVDMSSLTTIYSSGGSACSNMFRGCTNLTTVDLSSLTAISSSQGCSNMFQQCGMTNVVLPSLTIVNGSNVCQYMFQQCSRLVSVSFPALSNNFGSNTNQFSYMLYGVTGCTVHFPSNLQSVIGSWTSVTGGFSGTNTTVLFDLPATNTLTGVDTVTYTRNPKYDTATALAWKVGAYGTTNFTPAYYTSGLTDPTVGTTIYSDAACTVSVTTVDTVA